jgi:glycosyltransferase involved in cell wall biosynthesis
VYIYQSGVLFLSYRYGVPAIVTDAGSLKDDIIEGQTGLVCRSSDASDLARALKAFFASDMFAHREQAQATIVRFADERCSWEPITGTIAGVYRALQEPR